MIIFTMFGSFVSATASTKILICHWMFASNLECKKRFCQLFRVSNLICEDYSVG